MMKVQGWIDISQVSLPQFLSHVAEKIENVKKV